MELILDKDVLVVPKSIQEEETPRDGGLWPEYAHTLTVCVDRFENELADGRIYSYCISTDRPFHSLDQMLFAIEDLLNESKLVQPWDKPRSLTMKKRKYRRKGPAGEEPEVPARMEPARVLQTITPIRGKMASFYLRVYSRQYASMQGVLAMAECKGVPTPFRSALELVRMLQGALEERTSFGKDSANGSKN